MKSIPYGGRFSETMNIAGAMELTMACATAGLVLGSVLGGPLAEYLVRRHGLTPLTWSTTGKKK